MGVATPYRHRSAPSGHRYLPKKQRDQLAMMRLAAQDAMNGRALFTDPVQVELRVELPIPKSFSKRKRNEALLGRVLPGVRPDLSNILKLAEDACSGVVFADDALVCAHTTLKRYGAAPMITLTVRALTSSPYRARAHVSGAARASQVRRKKTRPAPSR